MKINHPLFQYRVYIGNSTQIRLGVNPGWLNIVVEECRQDIKGKVYWLCVKQYQPRIPRVLTVLWLAKPLVAMIALWYVERIIKRGF